MLCTEDVFYSRFIVQVCSELSMVPLSLSSELQLRGFHLGVCLQHSQEFQDSLSGSASVSAQFRVRQVSVVEVVV